MRAFLAATGESRSMLRRCVRLDLVAPPVR
jgi:hypothetical protein